VHLQCLVWFSIAVQLPPAVLQEETVEIWKAARERERERERERDRDIDRDRERERETQRERERERDA
jgi:hypothetical protein